MKKLIFISVILLVLYSCSKQVQSNNPTSLSTIAIKDATDVTFDLSKLSNHAKYIKLETNDSCLIRNINKIFYIDGKIIIGSDDSILFFDKTGKFKYKIDHKGEGPKEYISLSDYDICRKGGIISILDTRGKKIMQYDLTGNFKRRINLENWSIGLQHFNDSIGILYNGNQISPPNNNKFRIYNIETSTLADSFYPISLKKSKYLHVRNANNFSKCKEEVLFCEMYNDTIYRLFPDKCSPYYYLDFDRVKIPASYLEGDYKNIVEFQNDISKHDFSYGINSLVNLPNGILISYFSDNKKNYLYHNKAAQTSVQFHQFTDKPAFNNHNIDMRKYNVRFYSDDSYVFTVTNNELYIKEYDYIIDTKLKEQLKTLQIDDNPIIRICRANNSFKADE